ncbi:MAG: AAA family ATPase [Candidatus Gracilibacteria bacterium]|nr:AAA family ATPase [Candidatus Gracilibacteria bacterium]
MNNKGGVGKTTIAYNVAIKFAEKGYKTVLVDLDPQCNLSRLALGEKFEEDYLIENDFSIFGVLKNIVYGGGDVDLSIKFKKIKENLSILPGSLDLSLFEDLLSSSFSEAGSGQALGYFNTSAIDRFLSKKGLNEDIDIFIIDASPSLGLLNKAILLGTDYFVTPLMPDAFSVQGIKNLGKTFSKWKKSWKNTALAMAGEIPNNRILRGEGLFLGYIINSYNQYAKKPIKFHNEFIKKIPEEIRENISEKHCKNGLVNLSWKKSLVDLKDYGQLPAISHLKSKGIFELIPGADFDEVTGTKENLELSKIQFEELVNNLIEIIDKY